MAGIYIHIPYCKQKCTYCDFYFKINLHDKQEMLKSIIKEIKLRKNYLTDQLVNSIYFGGGTPSRLEAKEIKSLLNNIYSCYKINKSAEITLECNPDDLNTSKLLEFKKIGINRLSIGVQSFSNTDLKFMNRSHNSEEAIRSIKLAQKVGFKNISIDLIYGLPKQTLIKWKKNIDQLFNLGVQHFSAYALTIEKKTTLYHLIKNKKIHPLTDKKVTAQFNLLQIEAKKRGFIHYEISNFGHEKFFSQHNTTYWNDNHYLGIGPFADLKKIGWPSTFLNALTGEFTPPGIRDWACSKRDSEFFLFKGI